MPEFPVFGSNEFNETRRSGCADDSCNINYIINRQTTTSGSGSDSCCDCPPGPQGPPGPKGETGTSGSTGCSNVYAGPLLPANTGPIDEQAFQDLLSNKGYIVKLEVTGGLYNQVEVDADVTTYPGGNIQFVNSSNGTLFAGNTSNETDFYPFAYETVSAVTGISYYNHTPTFGQFLEMCGLRDSAIGTADDRKNFYKVSNRSSIPSLLKCNNDPIPSRARLYTFISKDSSVTGGVNGPYHLTAFSDTVTGVINGSIRSSTYSSDNPVPLTNLGHQIVKSDGTVGVAYSCEDCIQGPSTSNRLTDVNALGSCDVFVDTENGVMYTRDETGDWPSGAPRFNENGIPFRRQPQIPEIPSPPPKNPKVDYTFMARITGSTPVAGAPPFFKWTYTFEAVFPATNGTFITTVPSVTGSAMNGAEVNNDLNGIGLGLFDAFPAGSFEMLPIRTGTIVMMQKEPTISTYAFSIPNAYKARCE
jgi:hypothetical protein